MFLKDFNEYQQKLFLGVAREMIDADMKVTDEEKRMIAALSAEMGQPEMIRNPGDDVLKMYFPDKNSRVAMMLELIALSGCDGKFAEEEGAIINRLKKLFELSDEDLQGYMTWVKKLFATYGEAADFFEYQKLG
ncbi:MAG: hypothetical protein ACOYXC_13290 [Candidatus Rifleibacteriota bacterium]